MKKDIKKEGPVEEQVEQIEQVEPLAQEIVKQETSATPEPVIAGEPMLVKKDGQDVLRISSPLAAGFWRCKRNFNREPVEIPVASLTKEQLDQFLGTSPKFLTIELLNK